MIEWLRNFFGLNRYAVRTTFYNGRHSYSGAMTFFAAKSELKRRRRCWPCASANKLVRISTPREEGGRYP